MRVKFTRVTLDLRICIVTKVNGVAVNTTTKVYRNLLAPSYDALPESCKSQTRYTLRTTEFYSSERKKKKKTSDKISCAEKVFSTYFI